MTSGRGFSSNSKNTFKKRSQLFQLAMTYCMNQESAEGCAQVWAFFKLFKGHSYKAQATVLIEILNYKPFDPTTTVLQCKQETFAGQKEPTQQ